MAKQEITHGGKQIIIEDAPEQPQILIDGEAIPVIQNEAGYIADHHSPYIAHKSLTDLAKHVVEEVLNKRRDNF